jgi:hypothetical protein
MKIDIAITLNRAVRRHAATTTPAASQQPASATAFDSAPAARVSLSPEVAYASDAARKNATEMREFLGKFDFRNITPRQLSEIGSNLFGREELTDVEASAFLGIEHNFATTQDPDKPMDAVAHFEKMLADEHRYAPEIGTRNGVRFRQAGLEALRNVTSFVSSDRSHIGP